ncbi:MAG: leucine-rich repeat protein [Lachnospiraceae bacterium]|nr:leucine-rich repeat protein [Lachnospiraceae bacterium]
MLRNDQYKIEDGILTAYLGTDAEVHVPEEVHTIGEGAFKGMAWITKVVLPPTIKKIGAFAFKGCRQMREIIIPEGLTEIGEYAFHRCHKLEELNLPKSLTKVDGYAFLYCDGLKKVMIEGPSSLGKAVFSHNLSLQEIALNENIDDSNFGEEVFEGCALMHAITLSGKRYEVNNLIEAMDSHSAYPRVIKSIAKGVYHTMQIEDGVLSKYSINLKSVVIPEGITAIGKSCFFDKKGIVSIHLPKSLKEIRANAFLNCVSLEEVTIQNEDMILDEKAFRGCCNLKRVQLQGETYLLEEEASNDLVTRIRDQVLGDFYISGHTLVRYMGDEEQIQLPKEIEIIGERCFFGKERLRIVTCPNSLKEIREQAFAGCVTLQGIVLSDKLKRIEREAFAECKKLVKCVLPETVEYIGEYAFRRCFLLKPFEVWPRGTKIHEYAFYLAKQFEGCAASMEGEASAAPVASMEGKAPAGPVATTAAQRSVAPATTAVQQYIIPPYAFARQSGLKTLHLTGVKRIGKYAYASCRDLEEVVIDAPECVIEQNALSASPKLRQVKIRAKELGKAAFSHCKGLEEVSLSGVSVLPTECFAGCLSLSIFEAKEITQMEARCFDECVHLDSFDFMGIRMIGERAFERCDALRKIELDQVECGYHAFADCAGLEEVAFSDKTVLKSGVFIGCTQLRRIHYDGVSYEFSRLSDGLNHAGNPYPPSVREVIAQVYSCFDVQERRILMGYSQDATEVTIPTDIEELGQDVFRDHIRLAKIHIPEGVRLFGSHAFSMTAWLDEQRKQSEFVIVNQVLLDATSCHGKVVLPTSIRRVASWCFAGNIDMTELVIPTDRIGIESLAFRNCLNLKKITDWNGTEYELRSVQDLTDKAYPELIARIFSECINCFKLDDAGKLIESTGNITKLTFPEGIKSVQDGVYKDCHLLETIDLSTDTQTIGKSAFENSKWLRSVTNAGNLAIIGQQAFSGCQSLESIDLSDHLRELGSRCFEHCISLKEIYLSEQLENIPQRAFFRCKSLKRITIPKHVKMIAAEAFAFCDGLEEVMLPEGTQVDERAFAYCENLRIQRYS